MFTDPAAEAASDAEGRFLTEELAEFAEQGERRSFVHVRRQVAHSYSSHRLAFRGPLRDGCGQPVEKPYTCR